MLLWISAEIHMCVASINVILVVNKWYGVEEFIMFESQLTMCIKLNLVSLL